MADAEADSTSASAPKNDGYLALSILIATVVVIALAAFLLWRNKKLLGISDSSWKSNSFTPPPEREKYIQAKAQLDLTNPNHVDELKKLLMRRAIQAIPILLNLQNEGTSIERLYKRGMLTDDMHFKVKELKAFVDQEFQDVQVEAEDLVEGWGQNIWPQAMQFHQMIQKQSEEREEEQNKLDEQKKKAQLEKKKEKEKAKKMAQKEGGKAVSDAPSLETLDPETMKAQEAERMAKLLLEEEEKERNSKKKGAKK